MRKSGFRIKGYYRNDKGEGYLNSTVYKTYEEAFRDKDYFLPSFHDTRVVFEEGIVVSNYQKRSGVKVRKHRRREPRK